MSRYQPSLRELAMEPDEDKRLEVGAQIAADYRGKCPILVGVLKGVVPFFAEMAAAIDEDAAELDERWDEREGWRNEREEWDAERDRLNAERDEAIAERDRYREERDESRRKYADRFFAVEGQTLLHANEVGEEVRREPIRSADEIWD